MLSVSPRFQHLTFFRAFRPGSPALAVLCKIRCIAVSTWKRVEDEELEALKRKEVQLKEYMKTLTRPRLTCFQAFGQTYSLPLRGGGKTIDRFPTAHEMQYLAGFFDGDGCVGAQTSLSGCQLIVGQVARNAEILFLFLKAFGGSIGVQSQGTGVRQPVLHWWACGEHAVAAAKHLSNFCIGKREQLQLATCWPKDREARQLKAAQLKKLKRCPPKVSSEHKLSWQYLAGLFDSDGSVQVKAVHSSPVLGIVQKHKALLLAIKAFLVNAEVVSAGQVRISAHGAGFKLELTDRTSVCHILQKLLEAGLLIKTSGALCALSLSSVNHEMIREQIDLYTGNQGRYKRLDAEGCRRAKEIISLQKKKQYQARRKFDDTAVENLKEKIDSLKLHHEMETLRTSLLLRLSDIQGLMLAGATSSHKALLDVEKEMGELARSESAIETGV